MNAIFQRLRASARAAKNSAGAAAWITYSEARGALASLVGSAALAAMLSPVAFGQYQYAAAAAGLLSAFALSGAHSAVSRAAATGHDGSLRQAFRAIFVSYLPVSLVSLGVAAYYWAQGDPTLSAAFAAIAVANPVANSAAAFASYLQGKGDFRRHARLGDPTVILPIGAAILAAYLGANAGVVIAANLITKAALNLACYRRVAREVPAGAPADPSFAANAVHGSGQNVVAATAGRLDSLVVFQALGAPELAAFSVATSVADRVATGFRSLALATFPKLAASDGNGAGAAIHRHRLAFALAGLAAAAAGIVAAPLVVRIAFPAYASVAGLAALYAGLSLLALAGTVPGTALAAQQRHRALYAAGVTSGVVGIAGVFLLGHAYGIGGAIVGRALGKVAGAAASWIGAGKLRG